MTSRSSGASRALRIRRIRITGWSALSALILTLVSFAVWAYTPYPAHPEAVRAVYLREDIVVNSDPHLVIVHPLADDGELAGSAMVFYPGARVDPHAYAATFADFVAETGMTVIIPRPTLNLALADGRSARELQALSPETDITAVGGHSLGGVKACQMAAELQVTHLVLLASYCATDISGTESKVLTLLGSQDLLTDQVAVGAAGELLPAASTTAMLEGLNHASFGDYGPQSGDGVATVSRSEATALVTHWLRELLTPQSAD